MSVVKIRAALEGALNAMTPSLATAWENVAFTPPAASTPYQRVFVLFTEPANPEYGPRHQELGLLQISLCYPLQAGSNAIAARAELIRALFKRGSTFTSAGVSVLITNTPSIGAGEVDGDRFVMPVKCRFMAQIG